MICQDLSFENPSLRSSMSFQCSRGPRLHRNSLYLFNSIAQQNIEMFTQAKLSPFQIVLDAGKNIQLGNPYSLFKS